MITEIRNIINSIIYTIELDFENKKKEALIKNFKQENEKKRKRVNYLTNELESINNEIQKNINKIQNLCNHEWDMIVVYGDPTSYECIKCNKWSRRRPFY